MTTPHTKTDSGKTGKGEGHGKASYAGAALASSAEQAGHAVKVGIVDSLSGLSTIETDIAALVRKTVSATLHTGDVAASELVEVIRHIVTGAIEASEEVGTGLTMSTKSVAKGVILGVHDVGGDVVTAAFEVMRSLVSIASTVGADIGTVARHAIDGVIEATVETGGNVAQISTKAIEGAITEAGNLGSLAVMTVKDVLIGIAGSLGQTIGAMLPHGAIQAEETAARHGRHAGKKPLHS